MKSFKNMTIEELEQLHSKIQAEIDSKKEKEDEPVVLMQATVKEDVYHLDDFTHEIENLAGNTCLATSNQLDKIIAKVKRTPFVKKGETLYSVYDGSDYVAWFRKDPNDETELYVHKNSRKFLNSVKKSKYTAQDLGWMCDDQLLH